MYKYLRSVALLHVAVHLLMVAMMGSWYPETITYRIVTASKHPDLFIYGSLVIGIVVILDAITSSTLRYGWCRLQNRFRYVPLLATALLFVYLTFLSTNHEVMAIYYGSVFLLTMALLYIDALHFNYKVKMKPPPEVKEPASHLKLYMVALILSFFLSYPLVAHSRDFDSEVGSIVDGAKVSVTLISFLGSSIRTALRLYSDKVRVDKPVIEAAVNIFVGVTCGWGFYMVADNAMDTAKLIAGILVSSMIPTFLLDKLTGGSIPRELGLTSQEEEYRDAHRTSESSDEGR